MPTPISYRDCTENELVAVQFRTELFNAANHTNFNLPGQNFGIADFGVVRSALDSRGFQFGLKVIF